MSSWEAAETSMHAWCLATVAPNARLQNIYLKTTQDHLLAEDAAKAGEDVVVEGI